MEGQEKIKKLQCPLGRAETPPELRPVPWGSPEFAQVERLRLENIGWNPAFELDFEQTERLRDQSSHVLGYYLCDELIGTVRMTPMGEGLTLAERLIDLREYFDRPEAVCDINRLALVKGHRGSDEFAGMVRRIIGWGIRHTRFEYATVLCGGRLAPLYRRVGCRTLASDRVWVSGGNSKRYTVMFYDSKDFDRGPASQDD